LKSCAQGQNFEAHCFIVANNATHNLTLLQINTLVIIYLEEKPMWLKSSGEVSRKSVGISWSPTTLLAIEDCQR